MIVCFCKLETHSTIAGEGEAICIQIICPKEQPIRIGAAAEGGMGIDFGVKVGQQRFIAQTEEIGVWRFDCNRNAVTTDADAALV